MRREDKIPLLGTDPPWSPEVLLDGRHAQPDVHLKGARWYLSRSRTRALLPCSLFPGGKPAGFNPLPHQPKVRARLRSLGFFGALSAECAEGIPALLSGGAGFARGVPAVPRELLGRALAPDPRCAPARPLPSWVSHGRTGRRAESGLDPGHPTPGGAPHSLSGTRGRGRPGGLIRQDPSRKSWSPPWAGASPRAAWAPVRRSIRLSVPWCGNPGGQGRDRGGSVRDDPTRRPI